MSKLPGLPLLERAESLETARLRLRIFAESDLDAFAVIHADAETMRYIGEGKTFNRRETWRFIATMLGHWAMRGYGMWVVEHKVSGEVLGRAGFYNPDGWPGFEVGWQLAREHWGRGYATEAAEAALQYAFDVLDQPRVISLIRPDNLASVRVAEKIGETFQERIDFLGDAALVYAVSRP